MCKVEIPPETAKVVRPVEGERVVVRGAFLDWVKPGLLISLVSSSVAAGAVFGVMQFHISDDQRHQTVTEKFQQHVLWHAPLEQARAETESARRDWYASEIAKLESALDRVRQRQAATEAAVLELQKRK